MYLGDVMTGTVRPCGYDVSPSQVGAFLHLLCQSYSKRDAVALVCRDLEGFRLVLLGPEDGALLPSLLYWLAGRHDHSHVLLEGHLPEVVHGLRQRALACNYLSITRSSIGHR